MSRATIFLVSLVFLQALTLAQTPSSNPPDSRPRAGSPGPLERALESRKTYEAAIAALRTRLVESFETKIKATRGSSSLNAEARAQRVAALQTDREQCRNSKTSIPTSDEMATEALAYERAAAKARRESRAAVKQAARELASAGKNEDAERLLNELDGYCPFCVEPTVSAARLKDKAGELKAQIIKGHASADAIDIRDKLQGLVEQAAKLKISAEDVTREARGLVDQIERSEPVKRGAKFKPLLESVANVITPALIEPS